MRRSLVLTHEGARHPFRQRLPRHVLQVQPAPPIGARPVKDDDHDWKLFCLSFVAFFTVAYTYIL